MDCSVVPLALDWDFDVISLDGQPFFPAIFDAQSGESVPEGFNAVSLSLDGKSNSDLCWEKAIDAARMYSQEGLQLFWQMDLGLFFRMTMPLSTPSQFSSLSFSLDHFSEKIWKSFSSSTLGLSLYRGSADFSRELPWDDTLLSRLREWLEERFDDLPTFGKEAGLSVANWEDISRDALQQSEKGAHILRIFCRDVCVDFLTLLATRLPCQAFALFDALPSCSPVAMMQLFSQERFQSLRCIIADKPESIQGLQWDGGASSIGFFSRTPQALLPRKEESLALCLPSDDFLLPSQNLEGAVQVLREKGISFRVIPEADLVMQWGGLDNLIVDPKALSGEGMRKLRGFCAAGGTVISLGDSLGLDYEMPFADFSMVTIQVSKI